MNRHWHEPPSQLREQTGHANEYLNGNTAPA